MISAIWCDVQCFLYSIAHNNIVQMRADPSLNWENPLEKPSEGEIEYLVYICDSTDYGTAGSAYDTVANKCDALNVY